MDAKSLRLLAEIIDCGSFTRAAEALNVTQPTLTRTIQHLESLTGAPLLKRGRYGVSATKLGEMMAREGRAVRAAVGEAQSALKQWRSGIEGQLRVGVGPMVAHSIMPRFVDHCLAADWKFGLRIHCEGAQSIVSGVKDGRLDVGLAPAEIRYMQDELRRDIAFGDDIGIYAGESHPLVGRKRPTLTQFEAADWIGNGAMAGLRKTTATLLEDLGLKNAQTSIEFSGDLTITLHLLATGRYLAILPNFLMRHLDDPRRFIRLHAPGLSFRRDIALWSRKDMESQPNITAFRDCFTAFIKTI